jgi:hypothetical protein
VNGRRHLGAVSFFPYMDSRRIPLRDVASRPDFLTVVMRANAAFATQRYAWSRQSTRRLRSNSSGFELA